MTEINEYLDIKAQLEEKLRILTTRAHDIDDNLREPADDDWSENATESEGDEVLEKVGSMTLDDIKKINSALSKIEARTYGTCDRCHKSIPLKRLEALPYATTCIKCH